MTPEEALNVLDQMAARAPGNRADHATVIQAVRLLTGIIVPPPEEPSPNGAEQDDDAVPAAN